MRLRALAALVVAAGVLPACSLLVDLAGFADGKSPDATPTSADGAIDIDGGSSTDASQEEECLLPTDAPQRGRAFYISPTGSDSNAGTTRDVPLLTFGVALGKLLPGDTLVLLDGEYGPLNIDCNNVSSGTPFEPILLRAEHERQARIKGDGTKRTINVVRCSNWILEGLYATSSDVTVTAAVNLDIVSLTYSNSVKFRRSVVARTNRCASLPSGYTQNGIFVYQSSDIIVEDNEVYDYHFAGITNYSAGTVLRGNYTNPRNWITRSPPPCVTSGEATGQIDIVAGGIFENAVSEGSLQGIRVGEDTVVRGSIVLNNATGLHGRPAWTTLQNGARVQDTLVANNDKGLVSEAWAFTLEGVTLFGNNQEAIRLANNGTSGVPPRNLFVKNSLFVKNGDFNFLTVDQWSFDQVNSFDNLPKNFPTTEPIDDTAGNIRSSQSTDPQNGLCIAYLPSSSPMHPGDGGVPIGANLRYRYRDGNLTCERYWDRTTGRIRCGAIIAGVNDDPMGNTVETRACINVHRRVNVANGCPIP